MAHNCSLDGLIKALKKISGVEDKKQAELLGEQNVLPSVDRNKGVFSNFRDTFNSEANFKGKTFKGVQGEEYLFARDNWASNRNNASLTNTIKGAQVALNPTDFNINGKLTRLDAFQQRKALWDYLMFKNFEAREGQGEELPFNLQPGEATSSASNLEAIIRQNPQLSGLLDHYNAVLDLSTQVGRQLGIIGEDATIPGRLPYEAEELLYAAQKQGVLDEGIYTNLDTILDSHLKRVDKAVNEYRFKAEVAEKYGTPYNPESPIPQGEEIMQLRPYDLMSIVNGGQQPANGIFTAIAEHYENRAGLPTGEAYTVPKEMVSDMDNFIDDVRLPEFWKAANQGTSNWKALVTANPLNPGVLRYVVNQLVQDNLMNFSMMDPTAWRSVPEAFVTLKDIIKDPKGQIEITLDNGQQKVFSSKEISEGLGITGVYTDTYGNATRPTSASYLEKFGNKPMRVLLGLPIIKQLGMGFDLLGDKIISTNEFRESLPKMASFLNQIKQGKSLVEAHEYAGERLLNLTRMSPTERAWFANGLVPFYNVYKQLIVTQAKALTGKYGAGAAVGAWMIGVGIPAAIDTVNMMRYPEQEEKLRKAYPNDHFFIASVDEDGNAIAVKYPAPVPLQMIGLDGLAPAIAHMVAGGTLEESTDILMRSLTREGSDNIAAGVPVVAPLIDTVEGLLSPGVQALSTLTTGYDPHTGRQIVKPDDSPMDRLSKAAGVGINAFNPIIGGWSRLTDTALSGNDQYQDFKSSLPDAVKNLAGVQDDNKPRSGTNQAYKLAGQIVGQTKDMKGPGILYQEEQQVGQLQSHKVKDFKKEESDFKRSERKQLNSDKDYVDLTPNLRKKVQSLLSSSKDDAGMSYRAIMDHMKQVDEYYAAVEKGQLKLTPQEQQALDQHYQVGQQYWNAWKNESHLRQQVAILVAKSYPDADSRTQTEIYKAALSQYSQLDTADVDTEETKTESTD